MRAVRLFIIECRQTHEEKIGSIFIEKRFSNQEKAIQYYPIMAVPEKWQEIAEVGDTLVVHFNLVTFLKNGKEVQLSPYNIVEDLYRVPEDMLHFVIKKNGEIKFFKDDCLVDGSITRDDVILTSGIILPDLRKETKKKDSMLEGVITAKSDKLDYVEVGDRVSMSPYSDYTIKMPDGKEKWFVSANSLLLKV